MFVVDGSVEAEIVFNPFTFSSVPAMPTTRQPWILPIWPTMLPVAPPAAETTQGFSGLRLAYFEEAEVGGEAVDAKEIEEIGVGEERMPGSFLEGALTLAGKDTVSLEAGEGRRLYLPFLKLELRIR